MIDCGENPHNLDAADIEMLRDLGLREDAVQAVSPVIVAKIKSSERFKNAFAHLHKLFADFDKLPTTE
jgi:hypothetical protein